MKKIALLISCLVLALGIVGCSSGGNQQGDSPQSDAVYGIGDTVEVDGVQYTLNGVALTDERNQFAEEEFAAVVEITYTIQNNTNSDISYGAGADLEVYGPDNKKADTYPNNNTFGSVAAGKAVDAVSYYGINGLGEIEMQFGPIISFADRAIFKATV